MGQIDRRSFLRHTAAAGAVIVSTRGPAFAEEVVPNSSGTEDAEAQGAGRGMRLPSPHLRRQVPVLPTRRTHDRERDGSATTGCCNAASG